MSLDLVNAVLKYHFDRRTSDDYYVLNIANIYRIGFYPSRPDDAMASAIFRELMIKCSAMHYNEALHYLESPVEAYDYDASASPVPPEYGDLVIEYLRRRREAVEARAEPRVTLLRRVANVIHPPPKPVRVAPVLRRPVGADLQNVHDKFVNDASKRLILQVLREYIASGKSVDAVKSIRIKLYGDVELHPHIDAVERVMATFSDEEKAIAEAVVYKIETMAECENLKYTLVTMLASAVENDLVVCSTGKRTRMVSVLQIDQNVCSLHTLRHEILHLAATIRKKCLATSNDQHNYDEKTAAKMKSTFDREFVAVYADKITAQQLRMFLKESEEYF